MFTDRDRLNNLPVVKAAEATMTVIDAVQDKSPAEQVTGIAASFVLACEHHGVEPQEIFSKVRNMMRYAEGRRPEFRGVKAYMKGEWD